VDQGDVRAIQLGSDEKIERLKGRALEMFYTSQTKECPLDAGEKPKTTLGEKCEERENSCKGVCGGSRAEPPVR